MRCDEPRLVWTSLSRDVNLLDMFLLRERKISLLTVPLQQPSV
jgi:hypothetical protein